ncbi:hypothetical protein [Arthrobacter caoxuetaonis]|uniref:Recombinase n=1 Tax=Arthrobacter caoxuetaonis TaxID=2886935 RepID=A0A9X1MGL0_9MICC|nr:hypothetical protein [Arthrobacter caoxuetaonis]MCC3299694.1 hypothetical protein [Arthrobacter caoxuetaonis]USQ58965.1 hypothetical protein NF551_17820 [Arthrobacter caoxuetaonis]
MTATITRPRRTSREWSLFQDWCSAADVVPMPATAETIAEFFREVPATGSTRNRQLQAIRRAHREAGLHLPLPTPEPRTPWRTGPGWLDLGTTLRRAPLSGWPSGLAARRDMFLVVLAGECGLSREGARSVAAGDVVQDACGSWSIGRHPIPRTPDAGSCPSCAVARWMKVLEIWDSRGRYSVREHVAGYRPDGEHECLEPAVHEGISAHTLLPGIDKYGWLADWEPMTARSISAVLAYRQDAAQWPRDPAPFEAVDVPERTDFQRTSMQDLTEMLDDLDDMVSAALRASEAVMKEVAASAK